MSTRKVTKKNRQKSARKGKSSHLGDLVVASGSLRYATASRAPVIKVPNATHIIKLPIAAVALNASAGSLALSYSVNVALTNNFTTRWGVVFREYVILASHFTVRPIANNNGVLWVAADELSSTAPTLASISQVTRLSMNLNSDASNIGLVDWKLEEMNDAGWTLATSTSPVPFYLKFYTDSTLGTSATATVALLEGDITVAFRGVI